LHWDAADDLDATRDPSRLSVGRYLVGIALLLATLLPLAAGAVRLRERVLPDWSGAPARLAEAVIGLATLLGICEVVGAVGLFKVGVVVPLCVLTGLVEARIGGRRGVVDDGAPAPAPPATDPVLRALGIGALAVVSGQWLLHTVLAYWNGMITNDSLVYHMPRSARFFQTGWLTKVHVVTPDFPNMFHPSNGEIVHAVGMLWFHHDVLSPLVNIGWLAMALLAGWCIGRPFGRGAIGLAGVAAVATLPVFIATQPGSAHTDIPAAALLLTTIALLVQPGDRRPATVLAGIAAGLALGTKLTVIAPVAVLTIATFALRGRSGWRRAATDWLLPMTIAGCYWFVRNLVVTGNPVPAVDLSAIGIPSPHFRIVDTQGFAVSHYLTDSDVWSTYFFPGLRLSYSLMWPALVLLAGAGIVIAALRPGPSRYVGPAAIATLLGAGLWVFTPTTAGGPEGQALLFASNVRYLMPMLSVGLALLGCSALLAGRMAARVAAGALAILIAGIAVANPTVPNAVTPVQPWPSDDRALGVALMLLVVVVAVLVVRRPPIPSIAVLTGGTALVVIGLASAFQLQRRHYDDRWTVRPLWVQFDHRVRDQRIAIAGFAPQYPLYGRDLSNRVQYIGRNQPHGGFTDVADCPEWRREVDEERPTLVVVQPVFLDTDHNQLQWTRTAPGAGAARTIRRATIVAFNPNAPVGTCPPPQAP
jgi:hypothetical protein